MKIYKKLIYNLKLKLGYSAFIEAETINLLKELNEDQFLRNKTMLFMFAIIDYCLFNSFSRDFIYNYRNCTIFDLNKCFDYALEKDNERFKIDILMEQWECFRPVKAKNERGYDFFNEFKEDVSDETLYLKIVEKCKNHFEQFNGNIRLFSLVK